ncbi:hypothetical protein BAC2_03540 [uncultured bacterium]|nr:hypothetical protein BAC2_03540 [uncultured bacterium]
MQLTCDPFALVLLCCNHAVDIPRPQLLTFGMFFSCMSQLNGHIIKRICQIANFIIRPAIHAVRKIATTNGLSRSHEL